MSVGKLGQRPAQTSAPKVGDTPQQVTKPQVDAERKPTATPRPALTRSQDAFETAPARTGPVLNPTPPGPTVTTDSTGRTVVDLGSRNNDATLSQTSDGRVRITENGRTTTLTAEQSRNVVIRGGDGNDRITVDDSVTRGVRIEGNAGSDTLRGGKGDDTLVGGDGDDYVEGGAGNDNLFGSAGRDVVYGLDGNDRIFGGADRDYVDGGQGDDSAYGGAGNDQVFGGRGNDTLGGGSGDDMIAGGHGTDSVRGDTGTDALYVQDDDTVSSAEASDKKTVVDLNTTNAAGKAPGSSIEIKGDPAFQARVQSDLDALASIPAGRELLIGLDNSGKKVTIEQSAPGDGNAARPANRPDAWLRPDGTPGPGTDGTAFYNPTGISLGGSEEWQARPPIVGLFHELVHVYNYTTGTLVDGQTDGVNSRELAAVGLPYDHDQDPGTPNITATHPTENQLREQLGLPLRPEY